MHLISIDLNPKAYIYINSTPKLYTFDCQDKLQEAEILGQGFEGETENVKDGRQAHILGTGMLEYLGKWLVIASLLHRGFGTNCQIGQ